MGKKNRIKNREQRMTARETVKAAQTRQQRQEAISKNIFRAGIAAILVASMAAFYFIVQSNQNKINTTLPLAKIGPTADAAGCDPYVFTDAEGNGDHIPYGERIDYETAPPAFGPHYVEPVGMARKYYTPQDRPDVESLVHNLEHGFTIIWYMADKITPAQDKQLRQIASKYPQQAGLEGKVIVAPWTEEDGKPFPDNKTVALTHWLFQRGDEPGQVGVRQYCDAPSGEALETFVKKFPFLNAPEGNVPG